MLALRMWGWVAQRPRFYALATRWAGRVLRLLGGASRRIHRLPGASGWTRNRDFPAPQGATFRDRYRKARRPG
jgi:L-lactate dehydrogenase complex protein LldF